MEGGRCGGDAARSTDGWTRARARQPARIRALAPTGGIGRSDPWRCAIAIAIVSGHWTDSVCSDRDRVLIMSPYSALSVAIPFPAPFEFEFVDRCPRPAHRPRSLLLTLIAIAAASQRNSLPLTAACAVVSSASWHCRRLQSKQQRSQQRWCSGAGKGGRSRIRNGKSNSVAAYVSLEQSTTDPKRAQRARSWLAMPGWEIDRGPWPASSREGGDCG